MNRDEQLLAIQERIKKVKVITGDTSVIADPVIMPQLWADIAAILDAGETTVRQVRERLAELQRLGCVGHVELPPLWGDAKSTHIKAVIYYNGSIVGRISGPDPDGRELLFALDTFIAKQRAKNTQRNDAELRAMDESGKKYDIHIAPEQLLDPMAEDDGYEIAAGVLAADSPCAMPGKCCTKLEKNMTAPGRDGVPITTGDSVMCLWLPEWTHSVALRGETVYTVDALLDLPDPELRLVEIPDESYRVSRFCKVRPKPAEPQTCNHHTTTSIAEPVKVASKPIIRDTYGVPITVGCWVMQPQRHPESIQVTEVYDKGGFQAGGVGSWCPVEWVVVPGPMEPANDPRWSEIQAAVGKAEFWRLEVYDAKEWSLRGCGGTQIVATNSDYPDPVAAIRRLTTPKPGPTVEELATRLLDAIDNGWDRVDSARIKQTASYLRKALDAKPAE